MRVNGWSVRIQTVIENFLGEAKVALAALSLPSTLQLRPLEYQVLHAIFESQQ